MEIQVDNANDWSKFNLFGIGIKPDNITSSLLMYPEFTESLIERRSFVNTLCGRLKSAC